MDILDISIAVKQALRKLGVDIESKKETILPETNIVTANADGINAWVNTTIDPLPVKKGDALTIIFDGTKYALAAITIVEDSDSFVFAFGNLGIMSMGDDTGEPFVVTYLTNYDDSIYELCVATATEGNHTIAIYKETETIHPIDPKYLPGVTIDLTEYGIDLVSFVLAGGGVTTVEGTAEMWQKITDAGGIVELICPLGEEFARLTPTMITFGGNPVSYGSLSTFLVVNMDNVMVKADINLMPHSNGSGYDGRTTIAVVVTQTALS